MDASFPKTEKLCGKFAVEQLYKEGKRFVVWPIRICYRETTENINRVLIWAPKSLFKHAVDRNLLRRRMREAYRLNKHIIEQPQYHIAFNYMDKSIHDSKVITKAIRKALNKINLTANEKMD
jgi:ribonuclease P protein component